MSWSVFLRQSSACTMRLSTFTLNSSLFAFNSGAYGAVPGSGYFLVPFSSQALGDERRDVGLGQATEHQVGRRGLDHGLYRIERVHHLIHAVVDPRLMHLLRRMVIALVGGMQAEPALYHRQEIAHEAHARVVAGARATI